MVYVSANPFMVRSAMSAIVPAMLTSLGLGGRVTSFGKDEKRMRKGLGQIRQKRPGVVSCHVIEAVDNDRTECIEFSHGIGGIR